MKIAEIYRLLFEYNLENLLSLFQEKYKEIKDNDPSNEHETLNQFIKSIETPLRQQNKFQFIDPYMKWIVQRYVTGKLNKYEDLMSKVIPGLLKYDSLKRKNKLKPEHKDINQIKDINHLLDILDEYKEEETLSGKEKEKEIEENFYRTGEAVLLYDDSEVKIVIPKSERASCFFGRNTRWCTAATQKENFFNSYIKMGDLFIILLKKENKRYQFHFETNQFMDEKDEPIENIGILLDRYPVIKKIFSKNPKAKNILVFNNDFKNFTLENIIKTTKIFPHFLLDLVEKTKNTPHEKFIKNKIFKIFQNDEITLEFYSKFLNKIDDLFYLINFNDNELFKILDNNVFLLTYFKNFKVKDDIIIKIFLKNPNLLSLQHYNNLLTLDIIKKILSMKINKFEKDKIIKHIIGQKIKNKEIFDFLVNNYKNEVYTNIKFLKNNYENINFNDLKNFFQKYPHEFVNVYEFFLDDNFLDLIKDIFDEKFLSLTYHLLFKNNDALKFLKFVNNPSEKIKKLIIEKNFDSIFYFKNINEKDIIHGLEYDIENFRKLFVLYPKKYNISKIFSKKNIMNGLKEYYEKNKKHLNREIDEQTLLHMKNIFNLFS